MTNINLAEAYQVLDAPADLTELLERLTSGFVIKKTMEAYPLLVRIISECLSQKTGSPTFSSKELAQEFSISIPTMTHWNRKLRHSGLVTTRREKRKLVYTPINCINPQGLFRDFIVDEIKDKNDLMYNDLFTRVRALELTIGQK